MSQGVEDVELALFVTFVKMMKTETIQPLPNIQVRTGDSCVTSALVNTVTMTICLTTNKTRKR